MDIINLSAVDLGIAIKKKELTSLELVTKTLEKIQQTDGKLNAYITVNGEQALKKAAEIDKLIAAGETLGPLAGVPVAIKDNICTKGIKTTCASKILNDFVPFYDATVVEKLEANGAIILGKTNLDEFAMGSTGETSYFKAVNNPFNTSHVSGGSSSGSAAAVASGEAVVALGSDTGGSIRQPAAFCSVTGFKPTYGTVSRYGLVAHASSLDQIGPLARDVRDCAALMDIIAGADPNDSTTINTKADFLNSLNADITGLKIGLPKECFEANGLDSEIALNVRQVATVLSERGAIVEQISLPFMEYAVAAYYIIASAEASSNLSRFDGVKYGLRAEAETLADLYKDTRTEGFGDEVKRRIMLGTFVLSSGYFDAYYRKALKVKAIITQKFDEVFKNFDLVLCPVTPVAAPKTGESLKEPLKMYLSDIFTVSANVAGLPALSVPCGFTKSGLPIGAQLIGKAFCDQTVLNCGFAYQQITDHHLKKAEVK